MLERDRRALRKRSTVLCKQLVVDEHFIQYLQADEILTDVMAEDVLVLTYLHSLWTAANRKLVDVILADVVAARINLLNSCRFGLLC